MKLAQVTLFAALAFGIQTANANCPDQFAGRVTDAAKAVQSKQYEAVLLDTKSKYPAHNATDSESSHAVSENHG